VKLMGVKFVKIEATSEENDKREGRGKAREDEEKLEWGRKRRVREVGSAGGYSGECVGGGKEVRASVVDASLPASARVI